MLGGLVSIGLMLSACSPSSPESTDEMRTQLDYPSTRKVDSSDTYFGTTVLDPYRWLEDDTASDTKAWVKAQNAVSLPYLESLPGRAGIRQRLEELWDYTKQSAPRQVGDFYFFYRNDGLQNQPVIYRQKGSEGEPEVFIDPNAMNEEGTTSVSLSGDSKDGRFIAVDISEAGSDWSNLKVMDVATGEMMDDELEWVKFSGVAWYGDGFYYSRYPAPAPGSELSAVSKDHMVYYHKLGTPQSEDQLVYRNEENPNLYHWVSITEDEEYLVLYAASGTDGYECHFKHLPSDGPFQPLFTGFDNKSSVIDHIDGRFLVQTDIDAPNYRVVAIDPRFTSKEDWTEIIPESEHLLEQANTGGGKMFLQYLEDASTHLYVVGQDGKERVEIALPGSGSAGGLGGKKGQTTFFYSYTSFNYPTTIFQLDLPAMETKEYFRPQVDFDPEAFVSKQVKYPSEDGTMVNMFIVHKKDMEMDGTAPALLYGYGGFNISITPSFSTSNIAFLEKGGVYAVANLRGGGEYGEEWHKDGMLLKKQNVFDDFIAAAEYLIAERYTQRDRLAIEGRSNGGLLVGAAMTQRPDLFAVAFPGVGVMDMLRYHKFTVGWGWIPEYGCADSSEVHFQNLFGFSPYHNLVLGTAYPATMVTTADHDDRVVPAHSFKFAARLQECHIGERPVIIRIDVDAGHGAGKPTSMVLDELADKWAFLFHNVDFPI